MNSESARNRLNLDRLTAELATVLVEQIYVVTAGVEGATGVGQSAVKRGSLDVADGNVRGSPAAWD